MSDDFLRNPGYVARKFGVAVSTVRYWSDVGKLAIGQRTPGGHARYWNSEVERLWRDLSGNNPNSKSATTVSGMSSGTTPQKDASGGYHLTPRIKSSPPNASPASSPEPGQSEIEEHPDFLA